ncbi:uncharacterized protein N7477_006563 [Penicillium maclennaniae]|uniref:uncharacterized protein n=1 Tax=Penicillium maclennaniae TaxID=1343394 RepID=UPI0025419BC7|nr:uncharacterized protein N7477_006563 [Penicillium maclennaniae]KAJ5667993.1 hypothetical protein N7477_006563 [Penicillium maclennaniae]
MPVSHLTVTVSHLPTSTSFFLSCLQPLGYQFIGRVEDYIGFGQKAGALPISGSPSRSLAPSKEAVQSFVYAAVKAGAKLHGEPRERDSISGYYSAAVIDLDGNSVEAVYRPGASVVASEAGGPTIALLETRSVVSKSSKATSVKAESVAPPRSEAKSRAVSKAPTAVSKAPTAISKAPTAVSHRSQGPPPSYTTQTAQKPDDGSKVAKTIIGTLIGAAAGAAVAYAMVKGDSQSTSEEPKEAPHYTPESHQLMAPPSHVSSQLSKLPPTRSIYTSASGPRSTVTRSVFSKNPRASTIYEPTEFYDDRGRRASDGSIFSIPEDIPLRAIEYPPPSHSSQQRHPCNPSTFISSYAADKPRDGSVHSASTIKASQQSLQRRHSHDDRDTYSSHSKHSHRVSSSHSKGQDAVSTASSTRSARNIPLPTGSNATYYSASAHPGQGNKSHVSAREVPLPDSVIDLDLDSHVTPDDSISQVGSRTRSHSHRSSHSKASKHSSRSKMDEPIRPADSVSQVSRVSHRTVKAGGSKAPSHSGSRRSQVAV